jgi:type III pantothenate kinase
VFNKNELIFNKNYDSLTPLEVQEILNRFNIVHSIISNVRNTANNLENLLSTSTNFYQLNEQILLPFQNLYATPTTLGKDRMALIAAACNLFPQQNVLVVDMGTCITYDVVTADKKYFGGAISPGLNMRFKALNQFTGNLPLVEITENEKPNLIGDSTINSIKSGVYNGVKTELEGIIASYNKQYENIQVVLTGGNAEMFDLESKNRIFADKFFLLKGLNEILEYNAKNK